MEPTFWDFVATERTSIPRSSSPRRSFIFSTVSGRRTTWYCTCSQVGRVSPSIERISSPGSIPAASAGEPASSAPTIGRS